MKAAKLKAKPERFRAPPTRGEFAHGIDRDAGVITGYSVARLGVTVDGRYDFDDETLNKLVEFGNRSGRGIKSRFTHPSMSDDGMGKFLGRSRNFRRDGDAVRADLHLSRTAYDTPSGDLAGYVLDLAADDPDAFGASVVVAGKGEYRRNADGTMMQDADGRDLPPLLRVSKLYACDVVDDPAVDQGFFARAENDPARFAAELLNKHFAGASAEVIRERANAFLDRYLQDKGVSPMSADQNITTQNDAATTEQQQQLEADRAAFNAEREEFEKQRARFAEEKAIRELCAAVGAEKHVEKFIAAGLTLPAVKDELLKERKKDFSLGDDAGTRDVPGQKDPVAEAKAEYAKQAGHFAQLGISEEDFVYSRQVDLAQGCFALVR